MPGDAPIRALLQGVPLPAAGDVPRTLLQESMDDHRIGEPTMAELRRLGATMGMDCRPVLRSVPIDEKEEGGAPTFSKTTAAASSAAGASTPTASSPSSIGGDDSPRSSVAGSGSGSGSHGRAAATGDTDLFETMTGDELWTAAAQIAALPSIGSAEHGAGLCRPCAFARSAAGCRFGADCAFCHFVGEHPEPARVRPCKGKRDRLKRQMAALEKAVAEDPELYARGGLHLPSLADSSEAARARIMARLSEIAAEAYRQRIGPQGISL